MEPESKLSLPFLIRKMLSFEHAATIGLRIETTATTANRILIRGATREGKFVLRHVPTADRARATENFRLPDIPLWVSVTDVDAAFKRGDLTVRVFLTIDDDILQKLCAGLVYDNLGISWPDN